MLWVTNPGSQGCAASLLLRFSCSPTRQHWQHIMSNRLAPASLVRALHLLQPADSPLAITITSAALGTLTNNLTITQLMLPA